jgi:predicted flap endonuclease-1-like 5' DNA nuclease
MRVVFFFVLLLAAAWGGFALGWMANAWRNHRRNRDEDRSLRYQVATQDEELERMRDALERARSELLHLRARVADADDPTDDLTDDLTQITGATGGTARALERLGDQDARDVAAWTEADIERMLAELRASPGGAARLQWIEQALHREKYEQDP